MTYSKEQQTKRPDKIKCKVVSCHNVAGDKKHNGFCYEHRGILKNKKKSKYNSVRQTYNGYNYDSKREAQEAFKLDQEIKEGKVIKWERQHKISLDVNGVHIANYFIDFKIYHSDGSIEYREVKGAETMLWRMKFKLAKALNPLWNFTIVR